MSLGAVDEGQSEIRINLPTQKRFGTSSVVERLETTFANGKEFVDYHAAL